MTADSFARVCDSLRPVLWAVSVLVVVWIVTDRWKKVCAPQNESGAQPESAVHR